MKRTGAAAVAGALVLLLAPDCTMDAAPSAAMTVGDGGSGGEVGVIPTPALPEGVVVSAAVWTLTWDRSRVVPDPLGSGWSVDSDLGYRVHVTSGWFVDHSVSLGPCVLPAPTGGASLGPLRFGIRSAHAHDQADPSGIESMHAEDLTHLGDAGPWPSAFAKTRYCRAHWLVARATSPSDAPAGIELQQTSVRLAGTWSREDGEEHDFTVDTWWPQGALLDLEDITEPAPFAAARADGEVRWAFITVQRRLGVLFDDIDFAVDSGDQVAGKLVDNLVSNASMRAELRRPNAG